MSETSVVSGFGSLAHWLLPCTCSGVVTVSGLLWTSLLAQSWSANVLGLDWLPLLWSLLSQVYPSLGSWFSPTSVELVTSGLL